MSLEFGGFGRTSKNRLGRSKPALKRVQSIIPRVAIVSWLTFADAVAVNARIEISGNSVFRNPEYINFLRSRSNYFGIMYVVKFERSNFSIMSLQILGT